MKSTMQETPLLISRLLTFGTTVHAAEVVTWTADGRGARRTATSASRPPGSPMRCGGWASTATSGSARSCGTTRSTSSLPRRPEHGRGAARAEHPALPRADHLHRQPRRGPGGRRRQLAWPRRSQAAAAPDDRAARRSSTARCRTTTRAALAAADVEAVHDCRRCSTASRTTFDWPELDERDARRDVLHVRDHRQPQGRRLLATGRTTCTPCSSACRRRWPRPGRPACWRSCRCSTPTRGACRTPRCMSGAR